MIDHLINKIIPPNDYTHRNGFSNIHIIDSLSQQEIALVESALINKLSIEKSDMLIIETLAYLKSEKSLPLLYDILDGSTDPVVRLTVSAAVYQINNDPAMISLGIDSLKQIDNKADAYYTYKLISAFYYLKKFGRPEVDNIIQQYTTHKDTLVSYNAKRVLGK